MSLSALKASKKLNKKRRKGNKNEGKGLTKAARGRERKVEERRAAK